MRTNNIYIYQPLILNIFPKIIEIAYFPKKCEDQTECRPVQGLAEFKSDI
jgi:hypothetical protein